MEGGMKNNLFYSLFLVLFLTMLMTGFITCKKSSIEEGFGDSLKVETKEQFDARMAWWREARFGLFLHWGLYSIPAGEWERRIDHAEWILTTAQIPVEQYETFAPHFNPVKFDAADWVRMAKDAGMKYIVITSKGGNFLLNVGPTAEGLFPQPSIDRLKAMGEWMRVYSESIYGTTASLFSKLDWGRSTTKGQKLYLHVFDWPQNGVLEVPGLLSQIEKAYLLNDLEKEFFVTYLEGSAEIAISQQAPNPIVSVIVLEFTSPPEVVNAKN